MEKQYQLFLDSFKCIPIAVISIFLWSQNLFISSRAQMVREGVTPQEEEIYNTLPGSEQKRSILDATNPMDLLNQLRRATAMDDATSPSDAIDDALKALELSQEDQKSMIE